MSPRPAVVFGLLHAGEHAGEEIARRLAGKKTKPFKYRDKGTMATIGRGAAVVQMLGGRTMKGKAAQLAWGTVHIALLPTNREGGVMADATTEFFAALGSRGHEPLLKRATGTMRFDLREGKKIERWLISVVKGDIVVSRRNARADAVVSADKALFERIATGETNALAAMLRDEVDVEGDVRLLVAFQRLLPSASRSRRRRSSTTGAGRKR